MCLKTKCNRKKEDYQMKKSILNIPIDKFRNILKDTNAQVYFSKGLF